MPVVNAYMHAMNVLPVLNGSAFFQWRHGIVWRYRQSRVRRKTNRLDKCLQLVNDSKCYFTYVCIDVRHTAVNHRRAVVDPFYSGYPVKSPCWHVTAVMGDYNLTAANGYILSLQPHFIAWSFAQSYVGKKHFETNWTCYCVIVPVVTTFRWHTVLQATVPGAGLAVIQPTTAFLSACNCPCMWVFQCVSHASLID
jgi:hypothetical protein